MHGLIRYLVFATLLALAAAAQSFPTRAVRLMVPFPPGGATDIIGRLVAAKMQEVWGQPVLVENRPGAGTVVGTDYVAKSAPDGYTLGMVVTAYVINPSLRSDLPYNTLKDLTGVTQVSVQHLVMAANPSFPANSIPELIALAKKEPGKLAYATPGSGTAMHLSVEMLKTNTGIDLVHVPYKGGAAAQQDVVAGHVPILMDVLYAVQPLIKSGRIKVLALLSPQRAPESPEYPVVSESVPGVSALSLVGIVAPAATPRDLVNRIGADIARAVKSSDLTERMKQQGMEPIGSTPEQFDALIRAEIEKWAKVVKQSGAKVDERSTWLDPPALDHRATPLDLRLHEGAEFLRGPGHDVEADLRHALADFGRAQRAHGSVVQPCHHVARSLRRRRDRLPGGDDQVRVSRLRGRRHIGQLRVARLSRHHERLHPAGLDVAGHRAQVLKREIDLIAHDVRLARGAALVRHVDRGEISALAKHLAGEVVRRAAPARAVGEAPGIFLRKLDQLSCRIRTQRRLRDQDVGRGHRERDRRKVAQRLIAQVLEQGRVDREHADRAHQDGVAVRFGLGDEFGGDGAVGAGPVLDHGRLAKEFLEHGADRAADDIRRPAGDEGDHDPDRLGGIALSQRRGRRARERERAGCNDEPHCVSPLHRYLTSPILFNISVSSLYSFHRSARSLSPAR